MQWIKAVKFGWIALVLALLSACSDHELQPLNGKGPVLVFGDSLTRGVGVKNQQSYPAVLARLSGHIVINGGVSGEITGEGFGYTTVCAKNTGEERIISAEPMGQTHCCPT